jgi:hypothetical protein
MLLVLKVLQFSGFLLFGEMHFFLAAVMSKQTQN